MVELEAPAKVPPVILRPPLDVRLALLPRVKVPEELVIAPPTLPRLFQLPPVMPRVPAMFPPEPKLIMPLPVAVALPLMVPVPLRVPPVAMLTVLPEARDPLTARLPELMVVMPV